MITCLSLIDIFLPMILSANHDERGITIDLVVILCLECGKRPRHPASRDRDHRSRPPANGPCNHVIASPAAAGCGDLLAFKLVRRTCPHVPDFPVVGQEPCAPDYSTRISPLRRTDHLILDIPHRIKYIFLDGWTFTGC